MKDVSAEIDAIRREQGPRLLVLGHHYERASVLRHADAIGDSLELSRKAASRPEAQRIVFCGVKFMAESADILSGPDQTVFMPDTSAGCPMANMATVEQAESAWQTLGRTATDFLPVVYVNSSAEVKAFCGKRGGSTCTSSNARKVFEWVFQQGKRVFFLPDEHLGRNTAADMGLPDPDVALWDPRAEGGGLRPDALTRSRVIVWKGFCLVHAAFSVEHIRAVRTRLPDAKIIVHPETPREVLRLADAHGSTAQIVQYVEAAPAGSTIVIGTEINLIERLAAVHRGRVEVKALSPSVCANMAKTNEHNLLRLLHEWPSDHEVHVPEDVAADARKALERMLAI